jgi:hypothetical protein
MAAIFSTAAAAFAAVPAAPGIVNYVEGQTTLDGRSITAQSVGTAQLQPGQTLETTNGRAELLLSPGVFLRVGQNSAVRMVSPDLLDTRVEVARGSALVEADQLHDEGRIRIQDNGSTTTLLKKGLYRFSADSPSVAVYDGKAQVMENDKTVEVKSGREVNLSGPLTESKFDKKSSEEHDQLYAWGKLRSEYLSEASASTARIYVSSPGWYGTGWYWNPMWRTYAWLPGDPVFYSPFGFGYYSPFAFGGPIYYYGPSYYRVAPRVVGPFGGGFRGSAVVAPRVGGTFHSGISAGLGRRGR